MLKKRRCGIVILLVTLCLVLACFVGCGGLDLPDNDNQQGNSSFGAVNKSSVEFFETSSSLVVQWRAVPDATSYSLRITTSGSSETFTTTVSGTSVDLYQVDGFQVPDSGSITIRLVAKKDNAESAPVTITYDLEGTLLLSPEIISFKNGVIEWKNNAAVSSYTVKVNGTASTVQSNTYDVSKLTGTTQIDISATAGGKTGPVTSVMYNAETKKLSAMPISVYKIDGDIIKWSEVGGAIGYKVVDLDFNAYVVKTPHYIMAIRNIVYGVYPVMAEDGAVASAEIAPVNINYLEGTGTESDPYVIKTPFNLRAIDYYELKYSETNGAKTNYYKLDASIDYNTVSALESESNMFTLRKPFYGTLDGGNNTLSNISVHNTNGYWAMIEYIAKGGVVKNIKFDNAEINNATQDTVHPINPSAAMVAYNNNGTVSNITVSNSKFNITAGSAAGLVIHNSGTVTNCVVNKCTFKENATNVMGSAAYEMSGAVLENLKGGTVSSNNVTDITITGTGSNIGTSAGVVAINRTGGTVKDNSFNGVTIKNQKTGKEAGGVVGYCANGGTVTKGSGTLGTLTVGTASVTSENGSGGKGKLYGKKG